MAENLEIVVRLRDLASRSVRGLGTNIDREISKSRRVVQRLGNAFDRLRNRVLSFRTLFVALGARFLVQQVSRFAEFAGQLDALTSSFENLSAAVGQLPQDLLEGIDRGASGAINRFEQLRAANQALLFGIADTPEEFERLAAASRRLGAAVGLDVTQAFDRLSLALARRSRKILDDLGIIVSIRDANVALADSLGIAANELNAAQENTAFLAASFDEIDRVLKELGPDTETLAISVARLKVGFGDLGAEIATALKGDIQESVRSLADFLERNGESIVKTIDRVVALLRTAGEVAFKLVRELLDVSAAFLEFKRTGDVVKDLGNFFDALATSVEFAGFVADQTTAKFLRLASAFARVAQTQAGLAALSLTGPSAAGAPLRLQKDLIQKLPEDAQKLLALSTLGTSLVAEGLGEASEFVKSAREGAIKLVEESGELAAELDRRAAALEGKSVADLVTGFARRLLSGEDEGSGPRVNSRAILEQKKQITDFFDDVLPGLDAAAAAFGGLADGAGATGARDRAVKIRDTLLETASAGVDVSNELARLQTGFAATAVEIERAQSRVGLAKDGFEELSEAASKAREEREKLTAAFREILPAPGALAGLPGAEGASELLESIRAQSESFIAAGGNIDTLTQKIVEGNAEVLATTRRTQAAFQLTEDGFERLADAFAEFDAKRKDLADQTVGAGFRDFFAGLRDEAFRLRDFTRGALESLGSSVTNSLGRALGDAVSGIRDTEEAFRRLARSVISDLSQIAVRLAIFGAIRAFASPIAAPALQLNARGGIAGPNEPQIFGEGSRAEAAIPLDAGRKIPVELQGSAAAPTVQQTLNFVFRSNTIAEEAALIERNQKRIATIVRDAYNSDFAYRAALSPTS